MGKRGPKPKKKVNTKWSANLAYAVGLIATDGCLSKNGRNIILISKEVEQLENYKKCLGIKVKNARHFSGYTKKTDCFRCQFSDINFYRFLVSIGLTSAKTKTISKLDIPDKFFFDFLRGCLDGDGCTYSYWDKRWKSSFMFYTEFVSASPRFILWLREKLRSMLNINGHLNKDGRKTTIQLKYAKQESSLLLKKMYYSKNVICLSRKRLKIEKTLSIVGMTLN